MMARRGTAPVRARSQQHLSAAEEYESGYRFGHAWLLSDEGREWQLGVAPGAQSPVPALRRLAADRGREYLRGFYDAVIGQPAEPDHETDPERHRDTDRGVRRSRRARPITVSVTLSAEEYAILKAAQTVDSVPTATRVRAMILAYATDAKIREAIDGMLIAGTEET